MKRVLAGVVAGAAALAGVALLGTGTASAGKPVLNGTLHCNTSGATTFSPGAVLSLAQLPKPKDKKIKVNTSTTYSGCTGSEPTSGIPVPTSATVTSKSKNPSRLCASLTSLGGGKTKYLFGTTHKSKGGLAGTTQSKADNTTPTNFADDLPVLSPGDTTTPWSNVDPPGPKTAGSGVGFNSWLVQNGNDGTVSLGSGGTLAGKAYAGKTISTIGNSGSLIQKVTDCTSPTGMTSVPTTGTVGIGVPA